MRISTNCCGFLATLFYMGSCLSAEAQSSINLVTNSSFETRNQEPQGNGNIAPFSVYNDLPSWQNAKASPDYMTSTTPVNTVSTLQNTVYGGAYEPFYPRTGTGCVRIVGYRIQNNTESYEFIRQQLSGLIINHRYHASFYALRRPTTQYKSKLSLTVYNSEPYFNSMSASTTLTPSPHTSIISQNYITDTNNWTLVEGDFIARAPTQWIALGYEGKDEVFDSAIKYVPENTFSKQFEDTQVYMLDDVSVIDMGCLAAPGPLSWTYNVPPRRIRVRIPSMVGAISYNWYIGGNLQSVHSTILDVPTSSLVDCYTPLVVEVEAVSSTCVSQRTRQNFYPEDCQVGNKGAAAASPEKVSTAYPNPATEWINVPNGTTDATIVNDKGKTLQRVDASGKLNVQSLPDGTYILQMIQKGKSINQRIQVKH